MKLRPHHIERIIELETKNWVNRIIRSVGSRLIYGKDYQENLRNVMRRLRQGEHISVTLSEDDLCSSCMYATHCLSGEYEKAEESAPRYIKNILNLFNLALTLPDTRKQDLKSLYKFRLTPNENIALERVKEAPNPDLMKEHY